MNADLDWQLASLLRGCPPNSSIRRLRYTRRERLNFWLFGRWPRSAAQRRYDAIQHDRRMLGL